MTIKVVEHGVVEHEGPKRGEGETFEKYRDRRCKEQVLLKEYLQGKRVG